MAEPPQDPQEPRDTERAQDESNEIEGAASVPEGREPEPDEPDAVDGGPTESGAMPFEEVLRRELRAVEASRARRGQPGVEVDEDDPPLRQAHDAHLTGLSFSGGGIRSATFNLGVLQGLARMGLLPRFDYLSVNSGGGYIGGWFGAWVRRKGLDRVARELAGDACRDDAPEEASDDGDEPAAARPDDAAEAAPVRFLRRFSNYLTPQVGAFSADTWTMVTTYLRNLLLNQAVLVLAIGAILLSPRLLLLLSKWFQSGLAGAETLREMRPLLDPLLGGAILFLAVGLGVILINLAEIGGGKRADDDRRTDRPTPFFAQQIGVQILVVVPLFAAAWLAAQWLWFAKAGAQAMTAAGQLEGVSLAAWLDARWGVWGRAVDALGTTGAEILSWAVLAAAVYLIGWLIASLVLIVVGKLRGRRTDEERERRFWLAVVLASPFAGAVGGALLWTLTLLSRALESAFAAAEYEQPWHLLHVNVWKAPAIIVVFLLTAFVHTGLMGRAFPERLRQWWSRLGAWMLIYAVTWLGLFGIAIYGPILLVVFGAVAVAGLSAGWLGSTVLGVLVGKKEEPDGREAPAWRRLVVAAAPQIFIVGLLALVALGLHAVLSPAAGTATEADAPGLSRDCGFFWEPEDDLGLEVREIVDCHTERLFEGTTTGGVWTLLIVLGLAAVGLSSRVDVNEFSMHLFYRNRLIRAYLGASNRRRPQPFTGFDPTDDLPLSELSPLDGYDGPYPIHNVTLNLVSGKELAWQERKGTSWVFTPLASGFEVHEGRATRRLDRHGYRDTSGYRQTPDGITTGTAMTISGAAASPAMGAGTTPAMAFLLTVFNVRLGWWLGNPRHRKGWRDMGPRVGIFSLVSELFGHTDETSRYVYLSDGGHFENLALYELIRRRCRFIVATDAGADPDLAFADLGNVVRKCCTDFGVEIDIDPAQIRRDPGTGLSRWHCAVGTIRYDKVDGRVPPGTLVYLKASLTGDEPVDDQAYEAKHEQFPHEPTADQWFSESQFESYRKLGEHVATRVFHAADDEPGRLQREALFVRLAEAWFPPTGAPGGTFTRLTSDLDRLMERLRTDDALGFLVPQIYPEWPALAGQVQGAPAARLWLPESYDELVAGFFFCHSLVQLMEDCYLDLALDSEYDHPDNRGWMNLFKHWSWSGMMRATWSVTAATFGARFQVFCKRRLGLEVGSLVVQEERLERTRVDETLRSLAADGRLNSLERGLVAELAERNPDVDRLLLLRLAVRDPAGEATRDDVADFRFTFGFALVRDAGLLYFRIQDHLRKMGLARRSLRHLVRERLVERLVRLEPEQLPEWSRETSGESELDTLEALFASARFQEETEG